jgi:CP family cyanate transporter-like MFS transporter
MVTPRFLLTLALLWLAGAGLRLTILAVPPVLPAIQADLQMSGTQIGILSGLPVVLFAIAAVPGSLLIARLGALFTLVAGLLLTALGAATRGAFPSLAVLYGATILMGAGVAVMQPALPALVRQWTPARIGFATAVYTNGLLVGEIFPVALTIPYVLPLFGGSWQWSFVFWALPLVVVAGMVVLWAPRAEAKPAGGAALARWWPDWTDSLIWKLGLILGGANATYFGANAFLPGYLTGAGRPELIAPALSALNLGQLPASFLLLAAAGRLERKTWPYIATGLLALAAVIGIVAGAGWITVIAAGVVGFCCATVLILGLALPPLLGAPGDVARISAAMFTISYGLAVIVSVLAGAAWDLSGSPAFAFLPIAVALIPLILLTPSIRFPAKRPAE